MLEYLITCKPDSDPYLTSKTKHWPGKKPGSIFGKSIQYEILVTKEHCGTVYKHPCVWVGSIANIRFAIAG